MPTAVVTGGAGFLGSHLCDSLVARRIPRHLRRQPGDRVAAERRAPARRRLRLHEPRHHEPSRDRRAGRLHLPPREPGEPDRLPAPAAADAQGRLARHAQRARAREVEARALPARLDERGLRRSADPSAAGDVLGQREPDRPARRLRRGETLRGGADDGVSPPAGRRHVHRAHLQHVRAAHAPARRARDSDLRAPGARERAAHRVWRRLADEKLLLCRRSHPRSRWRSRRAGSISR